MRSLVKERFTPTLYQQRQRKKVTGDAPPRVARQVGTAFETGADPCGSPPAVCALFGFFFVVAIEDSSDFIAILVFTIEDACRLVAFFVLAVENLCTIIAFFVFTIEG